jgi:hypothetical protein
MPFYFRKSFRWGPFRYTIGSRSWSFSVGIGPLRKTWSSTGRETTSVRLADGLSYRKSARRKSR